MRILKNFPIFILLIVFAAAGCKKDNKNQTTKKAVGTKQIISDPAGASIYYGGKEIGKTPYTITAKPKFYTVKLVKNGYRSQFLSFQIKNGQNPKSSVSLDAHKSSVMIDSRPTKATVIFNEKKIGETPLIISDLSMGEHFVRLEKSGYSPKDVTFKINSERPQKVISVLDSNIGRMQIDSAPRGAKIIIEGKTIGITPFNGEYPDGTYQITLQAPNYRDYTTTIAIQKGKPTRIAPKLQLLPCSFEFKTVPSGAKVYWGGRYAGTTPLVIKDQIANTPYNLRIQLEGYETINTKLKTSPGKHEIKTFEFKRNRGDLDLVVNPAGVTVYLNNKKIGVTQESENRQTSKVMSIKNLKPGIYTVYCTHRRAIPNGKTKKIEVKAGETTRPAPISLWVPNAEVIYNDDSRESFIILSKHDNGIFVKTQDNISFTILHSKIKKINYFKDDQ